MDAHLHDELDALRAAGRWRSLRARAADAAEIDLSSNDYLDLARHPRVIAGAQAATARHGAGATASRLMSGHLDLHAELEARLAELAGMPSALLFPTGFQANLGVVTALAGHGDALFSDALNHASIIDGCRLSRADTRIYRHADVAHLDALLAAADGARRRVIVTDAVFSMDGDHAPLAELAEVARARNAWLVVDEAHAIGVHGAGGGLCRELGVRPEVLVGTLSKALGSGGGFAACAEPVRDLLVNRARAFIYTTGLAPACAGAALAALEEIAARPDLGATLCARAARFADGLRARGLDVPPCHGPIVPVILGDDRRTMAVADRLRAAGLLVTGIRPPTVPVGASRLRLSVTLAHTEAQLAEAAARIAEAILEETGHA